MGKFYLNNNKIYSRDKCSNLLHTDSAGSAVNTTNKPHYYARFYFYPLSPTQYYNENLGRKPERENYSGYDRLASPKCPMPVIIRIPLTNVIQQNREKVFYSKGNAQCKENSNFYAIGKDSVKVIPELHDMIVRQQELLVKDYLSLDTLPSFDLIFQDMDSVNLFNKMYLREHGVMKCIFKKYIDSSLFFNENYTIKPSLNLLKNSLSLYCDYELDYHYEVLVPDLKNILRGCISSNQGTYLCIKSDDKDYIEVLLNGRIEIYILFDSNKEKKYLLYRQ